MIFASIVVIDKENGSEGGFQDGSYFSRFTIYAKESTEAGGGGHLGGGRGCDNPSFCGVVGPETCMRQKSRSN